MTKELLMAIVDKLLNILNGVADTGFFDEEELQAIEEIDREWSKLCLMDKVTEHE